MLFSPNLSIASMAFLSLSSSVSLVLAKTKLCLSNQAPSGTPYSIAVSLSTLSRSITRLVLTPKTTSDVSYLSPRINRVLSRRIAILVTATRTGTSCQAHSCSVAIASIGIMLIRWTWWGGGQGQGQGRNTGREILPMQESAVQKSTGTYVIKWSRPGFSNIKCIWAGRHGWRLSRPSSLPTGPSSGIG